MDKPSMPCLFCGGDRSDPNHDWRCDGRQGHVEAEANALYGQMGDVPFEVGSDTSAQAAATLGEDARTRLEAVVYAAIKARPGTCDDVEATTGLPHQTASARIRGLVLRGHLI